MTTPHVFLTRFNVPTNKIETSIYSSDWLSERIALFETYTLPSVRAQTADERYWLVYLGADSPRWLRDYMSALEDEGLLTPVYLSERRPEAAIKADIQSVTGRISGPVITSNLDNDDGLASDYVTRLRALAVPHQHAVLYLDTGLILHGRSLYERTDRANAFSAVLGELSSPQFKSCWAEWHNRLHLVLPAHHAQGAPAWLQVIHTRNVSNRVRGRLTDPRRHRHLFPAAALNGSDTPTVPALLRDRLVMAPARGARDTARSGLARAARRAFGTTRYDEVKYELVRRLRRRPAPATRTLSHREMSR